MNFNDLIQNPRFLLRLRLIIYGLLVFFSFFIFIGISIMMERYHSGSCPLYAGYNRGFIGHSASKCHFPIVIAILFQLLYLLFRLVVLVLFLLGRLSQEMVLLSDTMELIYVLVDCVAFFLTFIGACIISSGLAQFCSQFNAVCSKLIGDYAAAHAAQAGAWISSILWLVVAVWGVLFVLKTGKIPFLNKKQESSSPKEPQSS